MYKSIGKSISGNLNGWTDGVTNYGMIAKGYDDITGILTLDVGYAPGPTLATTFHYLVFSDASTQTNGYITINAGRTLPLLAVPTPLVAYLKDVKPSGTAGGTFTAGAWQTRTLNTIEGDSSIVSLSASQFTLAPGKYEIEASAPAYRVGHAKIRLRNITEMSDTIIGSSGFVPVISDSTVVFNELKGVVVISRVATFEIQHRCGITGPNDGFGVADSFGVNEVYTTVKIKKIG